MNLPPLRSINSAVSGILCAALRPLRWAASQTIRPSLLPNYPAGRLILKLRKWKSTMTAAATGAQSAGPLDQSALGITGRWSSIILTRVQRRTAVDCPRERTRQILFRPLKHLTSCCRLSGAPAMGFKSETAQWFCVAISRSTQSWPILDPIQKSGKCRSKHMSCLGRRL